MVHARAGSIDMRMWTVNGFGFSKASSIIRCLEKATLRALVDVQCEGRAVCIDRNVFKGGADGLIDRRRSFLRGVLAGLYWRKYDVNRERRARPNLEAGQSDLFVSDVDQGIFFLPFSCSVGRRRLTCGVATCRPVGVCVARHLRGDDVYTRPRPD